MKILSAIYFDLKHFYNYLVVRDGIPQDGFSPQDTSQDGFYGCLNSIIILHVKSSLIILTTNFFTNILINTCLMLNFKYIGKGFVRASKPNDQRIFSV